MKTLTTLNENWTLASEVHKIEARLWRRARRDNTRLILMTSPCRGEGKSTTVAYLATAMALHPGRKILAFDLDFREPRLHTYFGDEPVHSAGELLAGRCEIEHAILKTELPTLDLILPSPRGEDPELLLRTQRLGQLFEKLRTNYDTVLLDVPALIPVADATAVLPLADGVVMVAMAGKTTRPLLRRAREICLGLDAKMLGLIVGNLEEALPEYRDYGYNYSYRRAKREKEESRANVAAA